MDRRISVVVPCFDAARHLCETLESIAAQTVVPADIVIVDDGSSDHSVVVAEEFRRSHEHLRVIVERTAHRGATTARNVGAAQASGDMLMFLDADDLLGPDVFEHLSTALAGQDDAVAVGPWCRLELADGTWQRRPASCAPRRPGDDALAGWLRNWYHPPCAVLWTRSGFERAGRWDELCGQNQDGDLMMRALVLGVTLTETSRGCSAYRRPSSGHSTVSGRRNTADGLRHRLRVVTKVAALVEDAGLLASYRAPLRDALTDIIRGAAATPGPDVAAVVSAARAQRFALRRLPDRVVGLVADRLPLAGASGSVPRAAVTRSGAQTGRLPTGQDAARPLVSVVIPTFQRAETITTAIDSVLAQTYEHFEILVVDDASTDDTAQVVGSYDDPRVRYLRCRSNNGAGAARNHGMRAACGGFVAFLDSDDVWTPDKLALQVDRFEASPTTTGLVYGGAEVEHADGRVTASTPHDRGDLHRVLLERNVIHGGGSNVMIRRSVVAAAGFFDERFAAVEDHDYWVRIARMSDIEFVDRPVCRYRDSGDDDRRSRHVERNLASRELFARKHRRTMLRSRVAAAYHLETARRQLRDSGDRAAARRSAWRAVTSDPLSAAAWNRTIRMSIPAVVVRALRGPQQRSSVRSGTTLRIALYTSTSTHETGGVQGVFAGVADRLRRAGHAVVEIRADAPLDGSGAENIAVAPVVVPDTRRGHRLRSLVDTWRTGAHLAAVLARHRPDVVNVHFLYPPELIHLLVLRPFLGYRLVMTAHGSDILHPIGPKTRWLPFLVRHADAITTVSPALTARVVETTGVESSRVVTIPNEIDLTFWRRGDALRSGTSDIAAVGRLTPVKGFDVLIDALPAIRRAVPDVRVVLVGDGPEHERLRQRAESLDVGSSLEMTGTLAQDDLRDVLSSAAVFAMPSRSEGMPLALLEAMAAGCAAVVSDIDGIAQVGGPSVRVRADDPTALAHALSCLLRDPDRASAIGALARCHVEQLSGAHTGPSYEDVFLTCAGRLATGASAR